MTASKTHIIFFIVNLLSYFNRRGWGLLGRTILIGAFPFCSKYVGGQKRAKFDEAPCKTG
jgi:hypothetical protein